MTKAPGQGPTRIPLIGQFRSYDRSWLRGDLIAGVTVAALIVPKNLGLRRHRRDPAAERSVRRGRRRASCTRSSAPAGRSRWDRARDWPRWPRAPCSPPGITGEQDVASFVAGITLASGMLFLLLAVLQDGLDRAVPLAGGGHRLPVRRGDRRRHRRAAQAHRDRRHRLRTRSRSCGRGWARSARRSATTVVVGVVALVVVFGLRAHRAAGPRRPGPGGRRAARRAGCFDLGAQGVALVGDVPSGLPSLRGSRRLS